MMEIEVFPWNRHSYILKHLIILILLFAAPLMRAQDKQDLQITMFPRFSISLGELEILDVFYGHFDPDRTVLTIDTQGDVIQWSIGRTAAEDKHETLLELGGAQTAAFSPDGHFLACSCGDENPIDGIQIIDLVELKSVHSVKGMFSNITFSPDGHYLMYTSFATREESTLTVIDMSTLEEVLTVQPQQRVTTVAFVGAETVAVAYNSQIELWDLTEQTLSKTLYQTLDADGGSEPVIALAASPVRDMFITRNSEGVVFSWGTQVDYPVYTHQIFSPQEPSQELKDFQMAFESSDQAVFIRDGHDLLAWNIFTGSLQTVLEDSVFLNVSAQEEELALIDSTNTLTVYNVSIYPK
jgi:WD40 repeat protein